MPSWFVRSNGRTFGPLDNQRLIKLVTDGKIVASTEVAQNQNGPWYPAGRVKGLNFANTELLSADNGSLPPTTPPRQSTSVQAGPARIANAPLSEQPTHRDEFSKDGRRFLSAISTDADKFAIVKPYLMEYEEPVAMAVQRKFPFSLFANIVLLSSHRLMLFLRFFNKIDMLDFNYVDLRNVKVKQGFFTSSLSAACSDGRSFNIGGLVTEQALGVYRLCQDIETKARIARRQYQLEENRSHTTQFNVNNVIANPSPQNPNPFGSAVNSAPLLPHQQNISQIGSEQTDPYRLGE